MTPDQISEVAAMYQSKLEGGGYANNKLDTNEHVNHRMRLPILDHTYWMCMELASADVSFEKANRWLGFIQGVLWVYGFYTVDEMRDHNRSQETIND